jgi:hypothetical protein
VRRYVRKYPADEVQVLIKPAARIVDAAREQRVLEGRYFVALLDRSDAVIEVSEKDYDWEDAIALARLFRGKSAAEARKWWARKKP